MSNENSSNLDVPNEFDTVFMACDDMDSPDNFSITSFKIQQPINANKTTTVKNMLHKGIRLEKTADFASELSQALKQIKIKEEEEQQQKNSKIQQKQVKKAQNIRPASTYRNSNKTQVIPRKSLNNKTVGPVIKITKSRIIERILENSNLKIHKSMGTSNTNLPKKSECLLKKGSQSYRGNMNKTITEKVKPHQEICTSRVNRSISNALNKSRGNSKNYDFTYLEKIASPMGLANKEKNRLSLVETKRISLVDKENAMKIANRNVTNNNVEKLKKTLNYYVGNNKNRTITTASKIKGMLRPSIVKQELIL